MKGIESIKELYGSMRKFSENLKWDRDLKMGFELSKYVQCSEHDWCDISRVQRALMYKCYKYLIRDNFLNLRAVNMLHVNYELLRFSHRCR